MEGRRILLNDGTTIENGEAGYSSGFLWCYFSGYTLPEAAALFFDTSKTEKIVFQYGDMEDTYTGYTRCIHISTNADETVAVCLERGAEIDVER